MNTPTFIRLENSLDKAMLYVTSPQTAYYSFNGVQLIPNHPFKYKQRTYATEGIEIEEWEVDVMDMCGNVLYTMQNNEFDVTRAFNDPQTGLPQVEWTLQTPYDADGRLIYLRINVGVNGYVYSSPFQLTEYGKEYTSRWDYRNKPNDEYYSIQLQIYFRQNKSQQEITVYNPVSDGVQYMPTSVINPYERWFTKVIEGDILEEFKKIFAMRYRFSLRENNISNELPVYTSLFEAIETPDFQGDENFLQQEILLTRNYRDVHNPNAVPVTPPTPPVDPPFIELERVQAPTQNTVRYSFTYGNFIVAPTAFTFQYSLDQITWIDSAQGVTTPQTVNVPNNNSFSYYYRIKYEPTNIVSNVLQLPILGLSIVNITSPDPQFMTSGNKYNVNYLINYTPSDFKFLVTESSTNGTDWQRTIPLDDNYRSPQQVLTQASGVQFTKFRIRDYESGLTSAAYEFNLPS